MRGCFPGPSAGVEIVFKVFRGCDKELGWPITKVMQQFPGVGQGAA